MLFGWWVVIFACDTQMILRLLGRFEKWQTHARTHAAQAASIYDWPRRWNGTGYHVWEIMGDIKKAFCLRRLSSIWFVLGFGLFGLYIIIFMGGLCPVACRSMNFSFFLCSTLVSSMLWWSVSCRMKSWCWLQALVFRTKRTSTAVRVYLWS